MTMCYAAGCTNVAKYDVSYYNGKYYSFQKLCNVCLNIARKEHGDDIVMVIKLKGDSNENP